MPMLCTDVTPCSLTYFIAASSARSCISADGAGTTASTRRHRVVLEHAGRLAVAVAHDLAARDVRGRARDAGGLQRGAVRERHVAVEPIDPDRMIRRHRIDPVARRQLAAPQAVVPVAAGDPRARGHGRGERLDPRDELLARARVAQLHGGEAESAVDEVHVRIDESRHDQPAAGIDDLRRHSPCERPRSCRPARARRRRSPAPAPRVARRRRSRSWR